jgi:ferritin
MKGVWKLLSKEMQDALNKQLNFELYSAYIYYSMAAYLESEDVPGFASWMQIQVQEELTHVDKFFHFINERDGRVILTAIDEPAKEWGSPLEAFEDAYKHEQIVSGRINKLVDLSLKESDHATNSFLQWFVTEQVEEEATVKTIIQQMKLAGKDGHGLLMLDRELGSRVFTMPVAEST